MSSKSPKLKYYIFNKPYGVLSQFSKEHEQHEVLSDYLNVGKDVYPVGRLDKDTEGLLLLTNDKPLVNKLLHPKFYHEKTYLARVDGDIGPKAIQQLQQGIDIKVNKKTHHCKPATAIVLSSEPSFPPRIPPVRFRKNIPTSWISLTISEGKNRQVRKMCAAVGYPVLRLVRTAFCGLKLNNLAPGTYIEIDRNLISNSI